MKKKLFKLIALLLFVMMTNVFAQADYSKPKDIAQAFLNLCLAGKRLEACQQYCTKESSSQMEILLMQMVRKDMPLVNDDCKYLIDSCKIYSSGETAKCYFIKLCDDVKMSKNGSLTMKKIDDEWRVEYIWKRDKYL